MNQHAKGPWHINAIDSKRNRVVGDENSAGWDKLQVNSANATIAWVYRKADARLIAASPSLYAAARLLEPVPGETMDAVMGALRAAVEKADGVTP